MFRQLSRIDLRPSGKGNSQILCTYSVPSALCKAGTMRRIFRSLRVNPCLNCAPEALNLVPDLAMRHTPSTLFNPYDILVGPRISLTL